MPPPAAPLRRPTTTGRRHRRRRTGPPRRRSTRWHAASSPEIERLIEGHHESVRALVADDPQAADLAPLAIEEDDAGRPEQAKALEQRDVIGVVGGNVGLQQHDVAKARAD